MLYCVDGSGIKVHVCSSYYLAQEVAENLKKRYIKDVNIFSSPFDSNLTTTSPTYFWDAGGSIFKPNFLFYFPLLGSLVISCRICQWDNFKDSIKSSLDELKSLEKYDGKFYKLHAYVSVVCLSRHQKVQLTQIVKNNLEDYDKESDQLWNNLNIEQK